MARRHRGPSMRALHWDEAKHPRDDRGRFAHKGGGRWLGRALKQVEARFGDIGMGAAPGSEPRGRLQTGKGGLIDTKAISRGAPRIESRTPLGPTEAPGGRVGRTATGVKTAVATAAPASGEHAAPARVARLANGIDKSRVSTQANGMSTTSNAKVQSMQGMQRAAAEARAVGLPEGSHLAPGGRLETPGREFSMQELKQILAGDSPFAHNAIRPTNEHRRLLEEAGATPAQSEAIMKKLGANTESGHLTADVSMALHFGAMREAADQADAARSAKLLEATPRAYAGLLGEGKGAVTHPRSRQVVEAMQANGWVLKDVRGAGGISTWGPPGDDSKSLVMIGGKDRPSFMVGNQKLSGTKAIEHVGGPASPKPTRTNRAPRTGNADLANTEPGNATPEGLRTNRQPDTLRRNEFGFPQAEGPAQPPVSHEQRRAASLATRDGIPPKDGRPDITMLAASNSKNDYHRWSLSTSEGRDPTMAPDVARVSGGVLDGKAVSAVVMNPKDGTGDYRYRIVEEGTGQVLEEGSGHDAGEVFAKADRIFSSQRGGGMARTAGNEVHYVARSQERPKDISRGDWGKGPFYDFTVNEVDRNGNERTVVKTNSMDRAHAQAAAMNAKEQGATERAAAALAESRRHSMADIYNRHRDVTRAQFDAMSTDEQQRVLNDLRKVRDSKEQVSSTIASNRTSMGTTIRGTRNAPHVEGAQAKLRELTYTAPPPPDNSIEAQRARLARGFASGSKEQLNQASIDAGLGGIPTSWKLDKMRDYLRARANAGDLYDQAFDTHSGRLNREKLAEALRQTGSREQAAGLLDAIDLLHGLTTADMQAAAATLGGTLRGSKRKHRDDLIELAAGRRADSAAIGRQAAGPTGRTASGVVGAPGSGFTEPPAAPEAPAAPTRTRKTPLERLEAQRETLRGRRDMAKERRISSRNSRIQSANESKLNNQIAALDAQIAAERENQRVTTARNAMGPTAVPSTTPNAEGGNFAAELRAGLGAGDQLARQTALRTSVASTAQERQLRDQAEAVNRRLRDVGTREEAQAELAGMTVEQLRELARVLNVRRDGATKQDLKDRIVERTVGNRLNAGVLGDPESLRTRAPHVPAPGSASSGHVELENLNQGDHVRVSGVDQYGRPMSLNGYVQGKPGQVTMRKGRTRKPMYAVQVSDTPSGGGANFRGVVYVEPGQLAERTEPGTGDVGPKGEAAGVAGRAIGGQDILTRSLGEPEKDAHGQMLVPGDEITIASRLHNREGERAHIVAIGVGKASGAQLAEVRYANGDTEQVLTGNIVRTTPAGKRYLDNLRAELGSRAPAALGEISGERPRDVAVLQAEARKRNNAAIKGRLERAARDLEVIRRGNASSDMILALDKPRTGRTASGLTQVDTPSVNRQTGGMTTTNATNVEAIDRVIGHLEATQATRAATDLRGIRQRATQPGTSAADTAAEIRIAAKGAPTDIKQALTKLARQLEAENKAAAPSKYGSLSDEQVRNGLEMRGTRDSELVAEAIRRGVLPNDVPTLNRAAGVPEAEVAVTGEVSAALPGGNASLGVRTTSKGRETVVTLPDGSVARRTSKTKEYTHAVVATVDNHRVAQSHQRRADEEQRYVDALQAWIDRGANISELKAYPTANLSHNEKQQGRSNKEYYLPGFEPTRETIRRSRYSGGGTYWADNKQYGIPDPADLKKYERVPGLTVTQARDMPTDRTEGLTKYEAYGPVYLLDFHQRTAQREADTAAKLQAGPQYSYHVARWSQSRSNATAALSSQELGADRPGYTLRVVGIEGATEGKAANSFGVMPSRLGELTPADAREAYQFLRSHQLTPAEADAYINSLKAKELRKIAGEAGMLAYDRQPLDAVRQRILDLATKEAR